MKIKYNSCGRFTNKFYRYILYGVYNDFESLEPEKIYLSCYIDVKSLRMG